MLLEADRRRPDGILAQAFGGGYGLFGSCDFGHGFHAAEIFHSERNTRKMLRASFPNREHQSKSASAPSPGISLLNVLDKTGLRDYVSGQLNRFSTGVSVILVFGGVLRDIRCNRLPAVASMRRVAQNFVLCSFVIPGFALPAPARSATRRCTEANHCGSLAEIGRGLLSKLTGTTHGAGGVRSPGSFRANISNL